MLLLRSSSSAVLFTDGVRDVLGFGSVSAAAPCLCRTPALALINVTPANTFQAVVLVDNVAEFINSSPCEVRGSNNNLHHHKRGCEASETVAFCR